MKVVHNDYNQLISLENILTCWREFKKGKSKKPDVMEFERHLEDNLFQLHHDLRFSRYRHGAYSTFNICDPKPRVISKANVRDRLVHHLVFKELYRIFEPTFIYHSYSSRINKGTHVAVRQTAACLRKVSRNNTRPAYVLKCDIKKFFWSIDHQKLFTIIKSKVNDKKFLSLTKELIDSFPRLSARQYERERERERVKILPWAVGDYPLAMLPHRFWLTYI